MALRGCFMRGISMGSDLTGIGMGIDVSVDIDIHVAS